MKKNWKETLQLWLGALLLLAESAVIGCKKLPKKAVALCIAAALVVAMVPVAVFAAETTYDIWVGGVQVTSTNKDDITTAITEAGGTADGTATYDPESEILTLNNFSYTGQGYEYDSLWCAAIFSKNDLTVKVVGSNTVTASVTGSYTAEALNVWGALTITGDSGSSLSLTGAGRGGVDCIGDLKIENVTVNATGTSGLSSGEGNITINNAEVTATATTNQLQHAAAIYAYEGNITIENSTVTANAPHANAVYSYKSDLRYTIKNSNVTISAAKMGIGLTVWTSLFVENSTVEVTSAAGLAIVNDQNNFGAAPNITGDHVVYAGNDAASATEADASADATYANKYVKIEPVKYDLWVGGVQVTSANLVIDSTDSTAITGGSATFDPAANTLTLNNFSYEGDGYMYDNSDGSGDYAAVYSGIDLTVKLVGTNNVTSSVTGYKIGVAFHVQGALTITDDTADETDSVLNLTGCNGDGLFSEGVLTIKNVTVKATGVSGNGIYCENAVNINNAIVNIVSNNSQALYSYDAITINNSNVTVSSDEHLGVILLDSAVMNISNSTVELTAGIGKNAIFNGRVPDFGSAAVIVMAGDDSASATAADAKASETYKNRYIKIIPACTVTVNYGIDGVNNKEIAVTKGDTISLENPVIDGHIFMGWFTDADFTTAFDFDTPITAATTVYAKFADYEGDKAELQDAIDALETAVGNVETALNNKVSTDKLTEEVGKLNQAIADAKTYADTQDAALKTTLEAADATMNAAIAALTTRVQDLEAALAAVNSKVDTNTSDVTALKSDVATLNTWKNEAQSAITALQTLTATQGADIARLNTAVRDLEAALAAANARIDDAEARIAALEGKVSALEIAKQNLDAAVAALNAAIIGKADTALLNQKVTDLIAAIAAAEDAAKTYADGKDTALQTQLTAAIATAKGEAITAAENLVNTAKAELQTAINNKADIATLNAKVAELNAAIATAEATAKAYTDSAVTTLNAAIITAKDEAVDAAKDLVDAAKAQLQAAIDNKADTAAVNAAIANLQNAITALQNAKDNYIAADAALKAELEEKIAKAKQEAIDAAKGHIPYIGTNGNWWIGDTDTGVDANGIKGDTGNGIASITTKKENGVTTITITFTDTTKQPVVFTISDGNKGDTGVDGVGVAKVEKTATNGNVDTYTITLTNGKTYTFTVTNGKDGADGKDGTDGKDGENGKDGLTPFIGENGNWWIGDADTGVKAVAEQTAQKGTDTITVVSIVGASVALLSNLALVVWIVTKKKKVLV